MVGAARTPVAEFVCGTLVGPEYVPSDGATICIGYWLVNVLSKVPLQDWPLATK